MNFKFLHEPVLKSLLLMRPSTAVSFINFSLLWAACFIRRSTFCSLVSLRILFLFCWACFFRRPAFVWQFHPSIFVFYEQTVSLDVQPFVLQFVRMEWSVDHSQVICDKIILAYLKQSTFARQLVYPFTYLSEVQFVVCLCVLSGIKMFYNWFRKVKLLGQGSGIFKVKQCT